jgi:glutamate formiminotransferase
VLRPIVECVPNFSEGRNQQTVDEIAEAIAHGSDVAVLDRTMDADHNRSVITFAGTPESVAAAAVRAVAKAAERIDLNFHNGVHPRLGAADVIPFVPVRGVSLADCAEIAHRVGAEIWQSLRIPVYFYEAAARRPERQRLENIRRGGFELIREAVQVDPSRHPDLGGPELHPTAGASIVGAREFLIAVNVNLRTENLEIAREIARIIRESSGGMPCVKALGLPLSSRRQVQISMNLTNFKRTPLHTVVDAIRGHAARRGVEVAGTEIIGLVPKAVIERAAEFYLRLENFTPDMVIEDRIATIESSAGLNKPKG